MGPGIRTPKQWDEQDRMLLVGAASQHMSAVERVLYPMINGWRGKAEDDYSNWLCAHIRALSFKRSKKKKETLINEASDPRKDFKCTRFLCPLSHLLDLVHSILPHLLDLVDPRKGAQILHDMVYMESKVRGYKKTSSLNA
eukprot:1142352-Pelagomonas_calceolata.AAC.4